MNRVKTGAVCWLTAGVAYVGLEAITAAAHPGYRYGRDFISDLGRPDSPLHSLMNTAFAVQGTLFFAGAALVSRTGGRAFVACAAANAVGNVVVASVPSGATGNAGLHVAGAVLAIVGGNAAIMVGATRRHRFLSFGLGAAGLLSFGCLAVATTTSTAVLLPSAVWERISVYTIIAWQTSAAVVLLSRRGVTDR